MSRNNASKRSMRLSVVDRTRWDREGATAIGLALCYSLSRRCPRPRCSEFRMGFAGEWKRGGEGRERRVGNVETRNAEKSAGRRHIMASITGT